MAAFPKREAIPPERASLLASPRWYDVFPTSFVTGCHDSRGGEAGLSLPTPNEASTAAPDLESSSEASLAATAAAAAGPFADAAASDPEPSSHSFARSSLGKTQGLRSCSQRRALGGERVKIAKRGCCCRCWSSVSLPPPPPPPLPSSFAPPKGGEKAPPRLLPPPPLSTSSASSIGSPSLLRTKYGCFDFSSHS